MNIRNFLELNTILTIFLLIFVINFNLNIYFIILIILIHFALTTYSRESSLIILYLSYFFFSHIFEFLFFDKLKNQLINDTFKITIIYFICLLIPQLVYKNRPINEKIYLDFKILIPFKDCFILFLVFTNIFIVLFHLNYIETNILNINILGQIIKKGIWINFFCLFLIEQKSYKFFKLNLVLLLSFICLTGFSRFELIIWALILCFNDQFTSKKLVSFSIAVLFIFLISPILKSIYYNFEINISYNLFLSMKELIISIITRISYAYEFIVYYLKSYSAINLENEFKLIDSDKISKIDLGILSNAVKYYGKYFFIQAIIFGLVLKITSILTSKFNKNIRLDIFFFIFLAHNSTLILEYIYLDIILLFIFISFLIINLLGFSEIKSIKNLFNKKKQ